MRYNLKLKTLAILLGMAFVGCNNPQKHDTTVDNVEPVQVPTSTPPEEEVLMATPPEEDVVMATPPEGREEYISVTASAPYNPGDGEEQVVGASPTSVEKDFIAKLSASKRIYLERKGQFFVWIGLKEYLPRKRKKMVEDTVVVPANPGAYVRITPHAPELKLDKEYEIVPLRERGVTVEFDFIPEKLGPCSIDAKIEVSNDPNNWENSYPIRPEDNLTVKVRVDRMEKIRTRLGLMDEEAWKTFQRFWAAFMALLFGALLYVIRKYVKKKTGYEEKEQENKPEE